MSIDVEAHTVHRGDVPIALTPSAASHCPRISPTPPAAAWTSTLMPGSTGKAERIR